MDRRRNGFTLIELLVVIAIIALLLGILLPVLGKVRDMGRSLVCGSLLKNFALSNISYATDYDNKYVPFSQAHETPKTWDERWPENKHFRRILTVNTRAKWEDDGWEDPFVFPLELCCPTHKPVLKQLDREEGRQRWSWHMEMSYGLNTELWSSNNLMNWFPADGKYRGHVHSRIRQSAQKIMFIETNAYQAKRARADYELWWDRYGDTIYGNGGALQGNFGQICYRHSQGANIAFFDGHTDRLRKEYIYDKNNPSPLTDPTNRAYDELWDVYGSDVRSDPGL